MILSLLRQIPLRTQSTAYFSKLATPIPGLHVYHNLLEANEASNLQNEAMQLHHALLRRSTTGSTHRAKTYLSQYHNLDSHEYYRLVRIDDGNKEITCQHFERYGEDGHKLTYFIGNNNLPSFIKNMLISRVLSLPPVMALAGNKDLEWNFTFNTYASSEHRLAGFNFHKDVASNGEATMIYSMGAKSEFQIRPATIAAQIHSYSLHPNSLILLSEKARWDYEHCVVPVTITDTPPLLVNSLEKIWRMSLVLGFAEKDQNNAKDHKAK